MALEPEEEKKKQLNDDVVAFITKRSCSEHEAPRYTARLKTYVDIQQKRRRANAARLHSELKPAGGRYKKTDELKDKSLENTDRQVNDEDRTSRNRAGNETRPHRSRSMSNSVSGGPSDAGCRRRRRRRRSVGISWSVVVL